MPSLFRPLQRSGVLFASALSLGMLGASQHHAALSQPATSAAPCPKAAVVQTATAITPVNKTNYAHAETEVILAEYVRKIAKGTCSSGVGEFLHLKKGMDPEDRTILRPNFDTLYSFAVLDLDSPATVVLPDTDRYQILEVVDGEHWIPLISDKPGRYELTKESMGSRYVFAFVRTQVNMQDAADLKKAGAVQDQIQLEQAQKGEFISPHKYDMKEILALRAAYNERMAPEGVTSEMAFGQRGEISEEMRNFGVAIGWGGLPKQGAVYPFPKVVNSTEPQKLVLKDVPNDPRAFWSVTIYDKQGFAVGEKYNINSAFAKQNTNGEYVIHVGGDASQDNYLDIYPGWNAAVRIYSPTEAYFNGSWIPPQFQPAQ
ncbi:DUF1254 domain-containing protein [Synechococcus sp. UW105]|uniref:DUF1254 domain-containing protein n=1 Tax=Synechococcus sp. UW105 TaxID=337067 RepID=UPI000E0F588F|nr:DUF1254 domain-containing protein [Synechococcus sp. UW105]